MKCAGSRGLLNFPETKTAGIHYHSPRVTDESKMQSSACITIEDNVEVSGEVGKITIPNHCCPVKKPDRCAART